MLKKIKDLTLEEIVRICKRHGNRCENCPLLLHDDWDRVCMLDNDIQEALNKEIEVKYYA